MEVTVYNICRNCGGDGTFEFTSGETPGQCVCPGCGGTGSVMHAKFELTPGLEDILDKVNDVLDKCNDILEKLDE
jgi:DnaJ-class molecular chaperone